MGNESDRTMLPIRRPPFSGAANRTLNGSQPDRRLITGLFAPPLLASVKLVEAMAGVLGGRGCDVQLAAIEFTDPRYAGRFKEFPAPHPFRELVGMIPATNLQEHHLEEARKFADGLASRLPASAR